MKRLFLWIALCFIIASIAYFFFQKSSDEVEAPMLEKTENKQRSALSVTIVSPQYIELPIQVRAYGDIAAWQEIVISTETVDMLSLVNVNVDVGDHVKAGQILAVFDTRSIDADIMQAKAALAEAKAIYGEALENAKRGKSLQKTGAMSAQEITRYVNEEKIAQARLNVAKATLESQKIRLQYATVVAPDDGVIVSRNATIGTVMGAGSELFKMVRQNRLEWRAELMSDELVKISPDLPALIGLPGGQCVEGTVRIVSPTVDNRSRTGLVYVDLPQNPLIKPGQFVQGVFNISKTQALVVPLQAIAVREAFNYVFLLDDDNHVRQVKITTGRRINNWVEILDGINNSDRLVSSGVEFLYDGDIVHVVNEASASGVNEPSLNQ